MLLVNTAGHPYVTDDFGGLNVPPNGTIEIEDGYCRPGKTMNGSRRPSVVEQLAPFLVPADPELRRRWGKEDVTPPQAQPTTDAVAAKLTADGMPPGVAELVASGNVEPPKKRGPGRPPKVVS
jgi:hypothetical protein